MTAEAGRSQERVERLEGLSAVADQCAEAETTAESHRSRTRAALDTAADLTRRLQQALEAVRAELGERLRSEAAARADAGPPSRPSHLSAPSLSAATLREIARCGWGWAGGAAAALHARMGTLEVVLADGEADRSSEGAAMVMMDTLSHLASPPRPSPLRRAPSLTPAKASSPTPVLR